MRRRCSTASWRILPCCLRALRTAAIRRLYLRHHRVLPRRRQVSLRRPSQLRHRLGSADDTAHNELCPVCGKQVTVGVMHRVEALADRPGDSDRPRPSLL